MSMSLDGFVAGPNEGRDNGEVFDEVMATGAVVTGRTTFEPAAGAATTTTGNTPRARRTSRRCSRVPAPPTLLRGPTPVG